MGSNEKSEFYLTLSNSGSASFYKNSPSDFRINLPTPVELVGEWCVGISHIMYKQTWHNVVEGSNVLEISRNHKAVETFLNSGYYNSEMDLIYEINQLIAANVSAPAPMLTLNPYNNKVKIDMQKGEALNFHPDLATLLGIHHSISEPREGVRPVNLGWKAEAVYVYCDIIEPQVVDTNKWELFKWFGAENKRFGDTVEKIFNTEYLPVCVKRFQTIHIKICNQDKQVIDFGDSLCIVQLHFKLNRIPIFY